MKIISETVVFVWDKGNKDKNAKKHGVTNEESEQAFTQGRKFFVRDEDHSTDEDRFMLWGCNNGQSIVEHYLCDTKW